MRTNTLMGSFTGLGFRAIIKLLRAMNLALQVQLKLKNNKVNTFTKNSAAKK